jgi:hypothetical protein
MTLAQWIGVALLALLVVFAIWACQQSAKGEPKKDKDPFQGLPPGFSVSLVSSRLRERPTEAEDRAVPGHFSREQTDRIAGRAPYALCGASQGSK